MGIAARAIADLDLVGDWGLLTTDANLTITGWNHWLELRFDRAAEEFMGHQLFDVFPNIIARNLDDYYRRSLCGQTVLLSQRLHKYLLPLPSLIAESHFDFMQQTCRIIPLMEGENVCGTVTVIEDVTERLVYEMELRERVEALRETDRRKDEFLAMLAHELRNPLAPITNAVHLLRYAGSQPTILESVSDLIERQVKHLVRLVDDLLDVSRVSQGKVRLQKAPVDLMAVVQQAIETSRPVIESRGHQLNILPPSQPIRVNGDFVRLAQVISNLLNNAAKYTEKSGLIEVVVEASSTGKAVVQVRDNGRGIEASALPSLFDMFYQTERNLDRSDGGLGIGLALVKNLTVMHGGTVKAQSPGRGKGSVFTIELPGLGNKTEAAPEVLPTSTSKASPTLILVVDDNRDAADSLSSLLKLCGHQVLTAHDGNTAVEVAVRERPAVILLDIGLPGINGYQACRAIREAGLTNSMIIAVTGYGQEEDRKLTEQANFNAHLVKPVELEKVLKFIAQAHQN